MSGGNKKFRSGKFTCATATGGCVSGRAECHGTGHWCYTASILGRAHSNLIMDKLIVISVWLMGQTDGTVFAYKGVPAKVCCTGEFSTPDKCLAYQLIKNLQATMPSSL
uniref:Uncharacterized protein n=1 Tax=Salix viminalis TaxID=40686 RepID=A0A6N2LLR7_SALVM